MDHKRITSVAHALNDGSDSAMSASLVLGNKSDALLLTT